MSNKIINQLLKSRVLSKARSKNLSAATPIVEDPTLQTWIKEVSSTIKDVAGSSVRKSDLVRAGIVTISNGELQNALTQNEEVNLTVPAAVVNLAANGAYSSITLDWETKPSKYFGQNTIYRSDVDDFGTATQIGSTLGDVYTDYVGNHIKAYYWVRTISKFGVEGDLAPSVYAETAIDVAYVMDQISGQISESHLDQLLRSEIGKITQNTSDLINEIKNRAAAVANLANQLRLEAEARVNDLIAYIDTEVLEKTVAEAQARAVAIAEEASKRTTELLAKANELKTELLAKANELKTEFTDLNAQRIQDILLLNDGLTSEVTSRKAGDTANLTALNNYKTSNNAALSNISETLNTAVDTGQATAEKVTALDTRLTTNEQVSSTALTKAESAVTSNSALASKVDNLTAIITDIGEGAETSVDVYAFNALKVEVNAQGDQVDTITSDLTTLTGTVSNLGNITNATNNAISELKTQQTATGTKVNQQGESITLLQNSVATINDDLATKVDSETFDSLTSQVTQDRANITAQGQSLTNIQNTLETTNNKINTKADASALTATDSKVANIDGRTTTNTNDTTALKGRMSTVENDLSTKADVSALNNIYTKTQSDAKAIELAAGEVSKYDANLVIGANNLITNSYKNFRTGQVDTPALVRQILADGSLKITENGLTVSSLLAYWIGVSSSMQAMYDELVVNKPFTVTLWFKAVDTQNLPTIEPTLYFAPSLNYFKLNTDLSQLASGKEVAYTYTRNWTGLTSSIPHLHFSAASLGGGLILTKWKVEKGSKSTDWTGAPQDIQTKLDANATAITNTNAEVSRVDGKTTVNANNISGLTSRMGTVEGQVSTKAEASALQNYYTKTEAAANATTVAAGEVAKYNAALKIGSKNLLAAAKWVTPAISTVNKADGYEFKLADSMSPYSNAWGMYGPWTELETGTQYVFSFKIKALDATPLTVGGHITGISGTGADVVYLDGVKVAGSTFAVGTPVVIPNDGKYHLVVVLMTKNTGGADSIYIQPNRLTNYTQPYNCSVKEVMLAEGNAYSQWIQPDEFIQGQIDANATAISNTNSEVSRVDGRVTTESNRITTLTGRVSTVENGLALKADVSALNNIYTKSETDAKATSLAAGEVSKYDASLVIGGDNLAANSDKALWSSYANSALVQADGIVNSTLKTKKAIRVSSTGGTDSIKAVRTFAGLELSANIVISVRVQNTGTNPIVVRCNGVESLKKDPASITLNSGEFKFIEWVGVTRSAYDFIQIIVNSNVVNNAISFEASEIKVEYGTKATAWTPSSKDTQTALDANATAIQNTNAEVGRVDGKVTANSNSIASLNSTVSNLGNTKLNASVIAGYYTKAETDNKVETVASGSIATFKSGLSAGATENIVLNGGVPQGRLEQYRAASYALKSGVPIYAAIGDTFFVRAKVTFKPTDPSHHIRLYIGGGIPSEPIYYADSTIFELNLVSPLTRNDVTTVNVYMFPNSTATTTAEFKVHWVEAYQGKNNAIDVTATALQSTNTEVSRINGVVSGHSTQLTNLNATIAGKADTTALNALTVRVANEEGKSSSQATSITNLNSSVANVLDSVTVSDTRSTNEPPSWYLAKYPKRVVNEFKTQTVIGVGGFFGGTYCNLETKVYYADLTGGDIIQTATSSVDPSLYVQRRSSGVSAWTAWAQPIKDLRDGLAGKASASAVSSLTTEVSRVNGVATSAANSTTLLTSRMGEAENKLLVQGKVTDGVRSSYVVKMETGNVVGGFGMVQETGALGNVITSFGVNADTFFIGSPSGNKKPFAVLGTSGLINGVTVPAGTYIDTAYIPNGTITNAKIGNLSADKITTGSIAADRMKANIVAAAQGQFTTLSALSAKIGVLRTATSGARTEIKDNLIEVYDASGQVRVRLGVW